MTDLDQLPPRAERLRMLERWRARLRKRTSSPESRNAARAVGQVEYKSARAGMRVRRLADGAWQAERGDLCVCAATAEEAAQALLGGSR
jgi:hypothetical protein